MIIILLSNVILSVGTPGIPGGAIASFAALHRASAGRTVLLVSHRIYKGLGGCTVEISTPAEPQR